jgi:hypothetical protein
MSVRRLVVALLDKVGQSSRPDVNNVLVIIPENMTSCVQVDLASDQTLSLLYLKTSTNVLMFVEFAVAVNVKTHLAATSVLVDLASGLMRISSSVLTLTNVKKHEVYVVLEHVRTLRAITHVYVQLVINCYPTIPAWICDQGTVT